MQWPYGLSKVNVFVVRLQLHSTDGQRGYGPLEQLVDRESNDIFNES